MINIVIVVAVFCFTPSIVHGLANLQPDVLYDMSGSFDNGAIKAEHVIGCGGHRDYTHVDVNHTGKFDGENVWFRWISTAKVLSIEISLTDSADAVLPVEWLYFVFDADKDAAEGLLSISSLSEICYQCALDRTLQIDFESGAFQRGTYWIGASGDFNISLACKNKVPVSLKELDPNELLMMVLIMVVLAGFALSSICWAGCVNYKYLKKEASKYARSDPTGTGPASAVEMAALNTQSGSVNAVIGGDQPAPLESALSVALDDDEDDEEYEKVKAKVLAEDPYKEDWEMILDMIDVAIDDEALDVYQALAFRQLWEEERTVPKELLADPENLISWEGIKFMFTFSKYQQALYKAAIASCLQTFGITITLLSVIQSYFGDEDGETSTDAQCEWEAEAWQADGAYKVLAFFWSWVIGVSVLVYQTKITSSGLNGLLHGKELPASGELRTKRLNNINGEIANIVILEYGKFNNYYTLMWAIIGSFFLIYQSEGGGDALDMILNAVALYFMIEVDDLLISKQDVNDLKKHRNELVKKLRRSQSAKNLIPSKTDKLGAVTRIVMYFSAFVRVLSGVVVVVSTLIVPFVILACW